MTVQTCSSAALHGRSIRRYLNVHESVAPYDTNHVQSNLEQGISTEAQSGCWCSLGYVHHVVWAVMYQ